MQRVYEENEWGKVSKRIVTICISVVWKKKKKMEKEKKKKHLGLEMRCVLSPVCSLPSPSFSPSLAPYLRQCWFCGGVIMVLRL